jgi:O-acetyl-ADP-ribose deacetylase (regulator of RNase III)
MQRERSYRFGKSVLTLRFGDIVSAEADVVVSSDDCYISMGGGVSASILRAGGEVIALDASKKVPAALGDIVVTTAGALAAQYVFHAITIGPNPKRLSPATIVERTTRRCMQLLEGLQLSSIAFPAIGAGVAGFSYEEVASKMAEVIAANLSDRRAPTAAIIYLFDQFGGMSDMDFIRFFEEFATRAPGIAARVAKKPHKRVNTKVTCLDLAEETEDEYKRRRIHNLRRLLGTLEEQRSKLEHQLIILLDRESGDEQGRVRTALKDNQELRLQYLTELEGLAGNAAKGVRTPRSKKDQTLTVFVSSTYKDLVEHRSRVKDAIARRDMFFRGMEHLGASPEGPPAAVVVEEVRKADVYLGIFGVRYGSIDRATGLSMTELEFRTAEADKKKMFLYLIDSSASVAAGDIEADSEGQQKLNALKTYMKQLHLVYQFKNVDDLQRQVESDLTNIR